MTLVRRGEKGSPVSAPEYDAVVDQVENNQDAVKEIEARFIDAEVTLSFGNLAEATADWTEKNNAGNTPSNDVLIFLEDLKEDYKWDSTVPAKAVATGRTFFEKAEVIEKDNPNLATSGKVADEFSKLGDFKKEKNQVNYYNNTFIELDGDLRTVFADYEVFVYDLTGINNIKINGSSKGGDVLVASFHDSSDISSSSLVSALITIDSGTEISVNANTSDIKAGFLAITKHKTYELDLLLNDVSSRLATAESKLNDLKEFVLNGEIAFANSYLRTTTLAVRSGFSDFDVYLYEVTPNTKYRLNGGNRGGEIMVLTQTSSETYSESVITDLTITLDNGSVFTDIDEMFETKSDTTHIFVTKRKDRDLVLSRPSVNYISNKNEESITVLNDLLGLGKIGLVKQMNNADNLLQKTLNSNYIDVKRLTNIRFLNYHLLTSTFVVPALNSSVLINVDINTASDYSVDDKIIVGTLGLHDVYTIDSIANTTELTCTLIESNCNLIGKTIPLDAGLSAFRVYNYEDLLRYKSNCFMRDIISFDKYHPNTDGYNLIGDIFSEQIIKLLPTVQRVILFGDSFIDDTVTGSSEEYRIENRIASNLGVTTVRNALKGQRIEYIIDTLFTPYMSTYVPLDGDFFIFMMGTNNLADIHRNPTDELEGVFNNSYPDVWMHAISVIQSNLPKSNYLIGSGFGNTDYY